MLNYTYTYNLTSWLFTYNFKIMFVYSFLLFKRFM